MLERVWFNCGHVSDLLVDNLHPFLVSSHNLVLLGFEIFYIKQAFEKTISELLKTFENLYPARIFTIGTSKDMRDSNYNLIPDLHHEEIVRGRVTSKIGMIDAYEEFTDF